MSHDDVPGGTPWLTYPLMFHSSREDNCTLTPEQCQYREGYWRYWYQADHRYGLTTVYFMIAFVAFFTIGNILQRFIFPKAPNVRLWQCGVAGFRYAAYRSFAIRPIGWWSPPLGYILVGLAGTIFFFGLALGPKPYYWSNTMEINFGNSPPIATRSGWIAVALLPFTLALSAKANLITALTGVSHEKLQVFHRWTSYAMFIFALIHTFPFIVHHVWKGDMELQWDTSVYYWTGVAALIPQAYLNFMSFGPIRNRFYEFFKATHFLAALVFVLFFFFHCNFRLSSWDYFIAAGAIYVPCLCYSHIRACLLTAFGHKAMLSLLPCGMLRVTVPLRRSNVVSNVIPISFRWSPGQHVFVRFLTLGIHSGSTHPFTICSLWPSDDKSEPELTLYIAPTKGLTGRLANLATKQTDCTINVLLDGPHGGMKIETMAKFDRVLIIAGGSGAGFTLPVVEDILRRYWNSDGRLEHLPTQVQVVLATRSHEVFEWYRQEIQHVLARYSVKDSGMQLSVAIHVTGREASRMESEPLQEDKSAGINDEEKIVPVSNTFQRPQVDGDIVCQTGRPDLPRMIESASCVKHSTLGIAVCGPAEMLYDVKNAAAKAEALVIKGDGPNEVYLHSEHFSW
ncbi:ferric-chelate reductase [Lineolata rhizophorae]|uniref:ferric-chelate reductase (NADPH) n=1 Tax=Lineolata rhizophorae TaxID=578093 RepID=A0A6A6NP49_9PEZI|nr:ferric-chelate reductase [Lineolata rhizophorae]